MRLRTPTTGKMDIQNRFLATLGRADRSGIEANLKTIRIEQGKILYEQGGAIDYVYFPLTGMISIVALLHEGDKAIEVATIGREGAVGLVAGFGPAHAFNRAIVQVGGVMSRVDTALFQRVVRKSDMLRDHIIRYNELLMAQIQQGVACNALHEAEARLSRWLLQTRDRIGSNIIPLTQEFLSEMLGVRRTTVTHVANALQKREIIRYRRGKIEIIDGEGLREVACECYETIRRRTQKYFPLANDVEG
jgi:CRP-like cAMP-binding protein